MNQRKLPTRSDVEGKLNKDMLPATITVDVLYGLVEKLHLIDHDQVTVKLESLTGITVKIKAKAKYSHLKARTEELVAAYNQQLGMLDDTMRFRLWNQITSSLVEIYHLMAEIESLMGELPVKLAN